MAKRTHTTAQAPHLQVGEALAMLIKRGQPGDRLPAEPALAAQLGVSRATLREALRSFQERGLVVRRHGVGTFIAPPYPLIDSGLEVLESIDQMASRSGLQTRMGQVTIEERPARRGELAGLGLRSATRILSIGRSILVDTRPVAYLWDAVPIECLRKDDLGETFNGSVLEPLLKHGEFVLVRSRTDLIATVADATLARQLHIHRGAALLKLEAQLYAQDGKIVDYSISYFVPGYFRFHVVRRINVK